MTELRRIEALIDWEQVRRTAAPLYNPGGVGRTGLDAAVLVKLALVLAWQGCPRCVSSSDFDDYLARFVEAGFEIAPSGLDGGVAQQLPAGHACARRRPGGSGRMGRSLVKRATG